MDVSLCQLGDTERAPTLRQVVRGIELAMLTTVDADGRPRTRPVVLVGRERDGQVWLLTGGGAAGVTPGAAVTVVYAVPGRWTSVSGTAEPVDDRRQLAELWTDACATWFPRGLADPSLRLLRVRVAIAETWDAESGKRTRLEVRDLDRLDRLDEDAGGEELTGEPPELEEVTAAASDEAQGAPWVREQSGRLLWSLEYVSSQHGQRPH